MGPTGASNGGRVHGSIAALRSASATGAYAPLSWADIGAYAAISRGRPTRRWSLSGMRAMQKEPSPTIDKTALVFLSRFGGLARTLSDRCKYVSLNVLQNLVRKRRRGLRDRP
jgi:hypothetical protein